MELSSQRLCLSHISKTFPGTKALSDVSLSIDKGEVRALVGENGAGKSTLMNIIGGVYGADPGAGRIYFDGQPVSFGSPSDSIQAGIGFVHQELSIFPHLSVAYNIFVDRLPLTKAGAIDQKKLHRDAQELLKHFNLQIDPGAKAGSLTIGNQQMIEIIRSISLNAKLIIFDEPTSSLSEKEVDMLFSIIRTLKSQDISVIYITHKMSEIYQICDSISVLRDGRLIRTDRREDVTMADIVNNMVGREISTYYPPKAEQIGDVVLQVKDMCLEPGGEPVSFDLRRNEVLGFYGLIGAGRSEILRAVCGIDKRAAGSVILEGETLDISSYQDALAYGITYLTEDRKATGIFPGLSVCKNMYVSNMYKEGGFFLDSSQEGALAREAVAHHNIKTSSVDAPISSLSGGNQQKVLLARSMRVEPRILILDEPTRGIDVNAKAEIHKKIRTLAQAGMGMIIVSSEMPEIMGLSDRIVVMHEGKVTGVLSGADINETAIIQYATGTFVN